MDRATLIKFAQFLGLDPHPSAAGREIFHLAAPGVGYRFEWHPKTRNVYLVRPTSKVGEVVAFNIDTHGDAHNAVLIWLRGYREGQTPDIAKPHLAG